MTAFALGFYYTSRLLWSELANAGWNQWIRAFRLGLSGKVQHLMWATAKSQNCLLLITVVASLTWFDNRMGEDWSSRGMFFSSDEVQSEGVKECSAWWTMTLFHFFLANNTKKCESPTPQRKGRMYPWEQVPGLALLKIRALRASW